MNEHTLLAQWKSSQVLGKKSPAWHQDARQSWKQNREEHSCASANIAAPALIYSTNHPPAASTIQPTQWLTHGLTSCVYILHLPEDSSRLKEFRYFHSLFNLASFHLISLSLFIIFFWPSPFLHLNKVHSSFTGTTEENHHSWPLFSHSPPFSKWFLRT